MQACNFRIDKLAYVVDWVPAAVKVPTATCFITYLVKQALDIFSRTRWDTKRTSMNKIKSSLGASSPNNVFFCTCVNPHSIHYSRSFTITQYIAILVHGTTGPGRSCQGHKSPPKTLGVAAASISAMFTTDKRYCTIILFCLV